MTRPMRGRTQTDLGRARAETVSFQLVEHDLQLCTCRVIQSKSALWMVHGMSRVAVETNPFSWLSISPPVLSLFYSWSSNRPPDLKGVS